jgi:hypothetical protein
MEGHPRLVVLLPFVPLQFMVKGYVKCAARETSACTRGGEGGKNEREEGRPAVEGEGESTIRYMLIANFSRQ